MCDIAAAVALLDVELADEDTELASLLLLLLLAAAAAAAAALSLCCC